MPGQGRPEIFPRACACPRDARRLLVRLARVTRGGMATGCDPARLVEAICAAVVEQQHDLSALVSRCSGRNMQRLPQTLLPLLTLRHLIDSSDGERPDLFRLPRTHSHSTYPPLRTHTDRV